MGMLVVSSQAGAMTETPTTAEPTGPRINRDQLRDLTRLRRTSDQPLLGGVAAGLSRYFDIDVIIVRVLFAALSVFGGAGFILYVAGWLTIPADDSADSIASRLLSVDWRRVMVLGLSIAGFFAVVGLTGAIGWGTQSAVPVVTIGLLAVVATLFLTRRSRSARPNATAAAGSAGSAGATGASAAAPALYAPDSDPSAHAPAATGGSTSVSATSVKQPAGRGPRDDSQPSVLPREPRRPRSHLFALTTGVIAMALGALWILDQTAYSDIVPSAYPATALAVTGMGLLVGAWWGRSRLLILVGLVATLLTVALTAAGDGPYGRQVEQPTAAADVKSSYEHGVGQFVLDLTEITDVESLNGRVVHVSSRFGLIELRLPSSMVVAVDAEVEHGEILGLPNVASFDNGGERFEASTAEVEAADLVVDVEMFAGEIRIEDVP